LRRLLAAALQGIENSAPIIDFRVPPGSSCPILSTIRRDFRFECLRGLNGATGDDWDYRCRLLCRWHCASRCDDDIDLEPHELRRDLGEALSASFPPPILDRDIATLGLAEFAQSLHKSGRPLILSRRRGRPKEPDHRHRRLLCTRRERPCGSAAEQGDKLAPSHELPLDEANKLPHHWTMWALCIAAKYSRLCRFRVKLERLYQRPHVSFRWLRTLVGKRRPVTQAACSAWRGIV